MAPRPHLAQHRPRHAEGPGEGHVQHLVPLFVGHLDDPLAAAQAGVIDQHIDAAEPFLGLVDQRLHIGLDGDIADLAEHLRLRVLFL
jgi:hypothetical protein